MSSHPGVGLVECRLQQHLRMRVSTDDQSVSRAVYVSGQFEPGELSYVRACVTLGATTADIGANIGVHSLVMADCIGDAGRHHAFEPSAAFERLADNVTLNRFGGRVTLNRCAVGATSGHLDLHLCRPGREAFTSAGIPLGAGSDTGATFRVPMVALDDYAAQKGIEAFDFVKMDVEGYEVEVLRGAQRLLSGRAISRLMFEVNTTCLRSCGSSPGELMSIVREAGFELRLLDHNTGKLESCTADPEGDWTTVVAWLPCVGEVGAA